MCFDWFEFGFVWITDAAGNIVGLDDVWIVTGTRDDDCPF